MTLDVSDSTRIMPNLLLIGIEINYLNKETTSVFISEINELQKMMIGFKKTLMKSEI